MRIFITVSILSAAFLVLFGLIGYFVLNSGAASLSVENIVVVVITLIAAIIVVSLLVGLCVNTGCSASCLIRWAGL